MQSLLDIAWLIPIAPTLGALFVLLLLVSFNRTINRLTKPVSYLLIICVGMSTILSFILFEKHLSGNALNLDLIILSLPFHFGLYVDSLASLFAASFGLLQGLAFVRLLLASALRLLV